MSTLRAACKILHACGVHRIAVQCGRICMTPVENLKKPAGSSEVRNVEIGIGSRVLKHSFQHPKAASAAKAAIDLEGLTARLEAAPFQNYAPLQNYAPFQDYAP